MPPLDAEEQAILESVELGEWPPVPDMAQERERDRSYAQAQVNGLAAVSLELPMSDLRCWDNGDDGTAAFGRPGTMTTATAPMSLADFFADTEDRDTLYELENGEPVAIAPESDRNRRIASFLFVYFFQQGIPHDRLRMKTEIAVSGSRVTVRLPDLMVLSEESAAALAEASRSTITMDMPPPRLVVEVVSPGKKNVDRDYRYKRAQYQAREVAEYWIVDPIAQRVTVLSLVEGLYEEAVFEGDAVMGSPLLTEMATTSALTASQVLQSPPGRG